VVNIPILICKTSLLHFPEAGYELYVVGVGKHIHRLHIRNLVSRLTDYVCVSGKSGRITGDIDQDGAIQSHNLSERLFINPAPWRVNHHTLKTTR